MTIKYDLLLDKSTIAKTLSKDLKKITISNSEYEYNTLSYKINKITINKLLPSIKNNHFCYFKSKDNINEYLGIGVIKSFRGIDSISSALNIIESNTKQNLIFMGGQNFSPLITNTNEWLKFSNCYYFLPRLVIAQNNNEYSLNINISNKSISSEVEKLNLIHEITRCLTFIFSRDSSYQYLSKELIPDQSKWIKNLELIKTKIDSNTTLEKVVMARKVKYSFNQEKGNNFANYFLDNVEKYPNSYNFYLSLGEKNNFISYSPEKFLKIEKKKLTIDAIAGSEKTKELLFSDKNIKEHRFVFSEIQSNLNELGIIFETLFKEETLDLGYIMHIHTMLKSKIENLKTLPSLINKLHPTPAVGGFPKDESIKAISENEGFNRGWYAAPVGIMSHKHTELLVAIRSILNHLNELHLFAGAGIISQSDSLEEWNETYQKMNNLFIPADENS